MNPNCKTLHLFPLTVFTTLIWSVSAAWGGLSLTNIPPVGSDPSNEGRAITPDGKYVGGLSGTANGFFYDVANDYLAVPLAGGYASIITGIGYRTDTNQTPPVLQIVLDGANSGWHGQYMTADGGLTWGAKRRDVNTYAWTDYPPPPANSLVGSVSGDVYYTIFRDSGRNNLYTCRGSNYWDASIAAQVQIIGKGLASDRGEVWGVAASGRIVGYRQVTGNPRKNYVMDYPNSSGTAWFFNGLNGTTDGQAFCISLDGNAIFGHSPMTVGGVAMYGYKAVVTSAMNSLQSVNPLPEFSDTGGSTSRAIPYGCTADGRYAVGMNYRGQEKAVLWDTGSADPALWTIVDLTDLAVANGVPDIFTRLGRAYSVGTNEVGDPVITGVGTEGSVSRAFLMTVPKWIAAIGFPGHRTVNYGATVTFSVVTNGADALSYQWYKNGQPLSGATSTSISFANVSCAGGEAGSYQVVVSNVPISGVVTSGVANLTVLDPFITAQPASRTNLEGTVATFSVTADGTPTVLYQWQRGGFNLSDGDSGWGSVIAGANTPTLTISNVNQNDAMSGDYTVVVTTTAGGCSVTSRAAKLTVVGLPILSSVVADGIGNYTLNITGPYGQTYKILYSTDLSLPLSSWIPLFTNTFTGGFDVFTDPAPADPQRFYILASPYVLTSP
ncbi:MAG TPA: immunoglobulin domain-containing protein [Candidatus Paceibacterota bacterium]|nr:immunoglobulin domain-containing protein [Candidatus Paceibacterota bacterium]